MTDAAHHARRSRKLVGVVLAAIVALVVPAAALAAPGGGGKPDGGGSEPTATSISIDSVRDTDAALPSGTPGVAGLAYVVAGDDFRVDVTFRDAQGQPTPLSWSRDVDLTLLIDGVPHDTISVAAEATFDSFEPPPILEPGRGLRMVVRADTKPKSISSSTRTFDVLIDDAPVQANNRTSIGGVSSDEGCTPVAPATTPGESVCADLLPPVGGFTSLGTLSQGVCGNDCEDAYIQVLVALNPNPANPATLVMKCDKDECGVGPIRRQVVLVNLSPEGGDSPLNEDVSAEACPAKGVVGEGQMFCIDYVQSTRNNAGDTFIYLLFYVDAKVRFS